MLYLVTGGSGSGKSEYAERKLCELCRQAGGGRKLYLATMIPYGGETKQKIARHRRMRQGKQFQTMECYLDLAGFVKRGFRDNPAEKRFVLLECMSNLIANELFDENSKLSGEENEFVIHQVLEGIHYLVDTCEDVVAVTNEVCSESAEDMLQMRRYKRILGAVNCRLAEEAAETTEVVYGTACVLPDKKRKELTGEEFTEKEETGMHLIIGGAFQGKLDYAKKIYPGLHWADGEVCTPEEVETCDGIYHFEQYVKRLLKSEEKPEKRIEELLLKTRRIRVIIGNEVGYGLVPVDTFERKYRETVGRICTKLAADATSVTRVVCGIGVRIK